jgi:transposase
MMYLGIDWSQTKHDACFLTDTGSIAAQLTFAHQSEGFAKLDTMRRQLGIALDECCVGLETAHSLLIDWLWTHGYTHLFVIPPNAVKSARQRYRQTGARTDQHDAFVIADMLRTDQARLQPWYPDSPLTQCIRAKVSLLLHLSQETTRTANRLRAVLARYYPAALAVFRDPASPIALQFIQAFPTPQMAAQLSRTDFATFVRARRYRQSEQVLTKAYTRLQRDYPVATMATIDAYREEAVLLAELLMALVQRRHTQLQALQIVFQQHPDAPIFASLPGAGGAACPSLTR